MSAWGFDQQTQKCLSAGLLAGEDETLLVGRDALIPNISRVHARAHVFDHSETPHRLTSLSWILACAVALESRFQGRA